jgi:hypothetical protein
MDMHSREQYLERVREEYRNADKRNKTRLLNEARKRTRLNRKVLIGKLAHPAAIRQNKKRGPRRRVYTGEVQAALIEVWGLFDYPCGQRLAPALRKEIGRLRRAKELVCSEAVAAKLEEISPRSIDRLLEREKRLRGLRQNRNPSVHPLLYQKVPVKVASEWDTTEVGNLQLDYVFHCGRSTAGEYVHTLSAADIATGWWEGEAIMGRSQLATKAGMEGIRQRLPFRIREVHPDNDSGMINDLLWGYCKDARPQIKMSRSRPYQKNDNCWVEQRNWTHVRKVAGYRRLDTAGELAILRELYRSVTLYKNFFQPTIKLVEKVRVEGKIQRRYDEPRTPFQRVMESGQISQAAQKRLQARYESLNVAVLHRRIEQLRDRLFAVTEAKPLPEAAGARHRGRGIRVVGAAQRLAQQRRRTSSQ